VKGTLATPSPDHSKFAQGNIMDRGLPGKRSHVKMPQPKRQMIIAIFIVAAVVASSVQLVFLMSQKSSDEPQIPARITMTPHDPILIVGNGDFLLTDAVRGGSGDRADPYVISDWEINATGGIGIYIIGTDVSFIIRNVTINSTAQDNDGILLEGASNGWIHNVTIWNCHTGVALTSGCSMIEIDESSVSNCADYGIVAQFGATSYVNVTKNRVSANAATGIALDNTVHFNVVSNNVSTDDVSSSGRRAITLINCAIGVVTGNNLSAVYNEALFASTCQGIEVSGNRFSSVWSYGISLIFCTGFLVYHNNFMGVPPQAYDNMGPENAWNASYPIGGNYWVEYTGMDVQSGPGQNLPGSDGIGDVPYVIDLNSTDRYPLNMSGPVEPIPEFPTLLLPMISVLALLFVAARRSSRKEF
jgi:hypothetical protein